MYFQESPTHTVYYVYTIYSVVYTRGIGHACVVTYMTHGQYFIPCKVFHKAVYL